MKHLFHVKQMLVCCVSPLMVCALGGEQGGDFCILVKQVAPVKSFVADFNDEVYVYVLWVEFLYEVVGSLHGSACGQ